MNLPFAKELNMNAYVYKKKNLENKIFVEIVYSLSFQNVSKYIYEWGTKQLCLNKERNTYK